MRKKSLVLLRPLIWEFILFYFKLKAQYSIKDIKYIFLNGVYFKPSKLIHI